MKKNIIALLLAVIMCLSLFTACGGGKDDSSANSPSAPDASGNNSGEVVYNMTVSFEESWWDPAYFMQSNDTGLGPMIYENLVEYKADGTVGPQLAESWEISDDGLTYTFKLREGVQWHKGYGEFTSEDVKFSIERHGDEALASVNAENIGLSNIASVECPDKYTVVIKLKEIDVDLLTRLGMHYSMIVCKAHNDKDGMESINTDPIGTGPFVFDGGTLGMKTEAVANKEWWGDRKGGNIDRVVNTFMNDTNTIYAAFENGEVDAISVYDYEKVAKYESDGYGVITSPFLQLLYVGVNMSEAPFDDPLVREAFFCAIDVDYFLNDLYYGEEEMPGTYIPPRSKYALQEYQKPNYDPERAKELLAQAGYPNGVDITFWASNDALGQPPAIVANDQLTKAGFNVTLQLVDFGVFIDQVRNGTAQMWCLYNTTGAIADDTMVRYTSEYYPGNNWCGVQDAEYDALVAAALSAKTEKEKEENFHAAQKRLMDLQTLYPIATYSMSSVSQKNISNNTTYGDYVFRATTVIKN